VVVLRIITVPVSVMHTVFVAVGPGRSGRRPGGPLLPKPFSTDDLVEYVTAGLGDAHGDVPAPSPPVGHTSEPQAPPSPLTPREVEVLRLVADGLTNDRAGAESRHLRGNRAVARGGTRWRSSTPTAAPRRSRLPCVSR